MAGSADQRNDSALDAAGTFFSGLDSSTDLLESAPSLAGDLRLGGQVLSQTAGSVARYAGPVATGFGVIQIGAGYYRSVLGS